MPLELSRLHNLRCGPALASVQIGEIPEIVAKSLTTEFRSVNLSREKYEEILRKHSDLRDNDFLQLPYILKHGLWIEEAGQINCRLVSSPIPSSDQRYKVVVKKSKSSPDLWLKSFHRTRPRATRALLKRGPIIRFFVP
jgi:hypothetical protein